ncbi:MAG: permease [Spirochaetes bacterium]|nr:permease [Spirochaetota bacterium]
MLVPTIIMAILALIFFMLAYKKGGGIPVQGLRSAWQLTIQVIPLLIFAFIIAGIVPLLIPKEMISKWIGEGSGIKGILIGTLAGAIAPGGPYVNLPLAAGFLRIGASIGTVVAFLTAWSLWALARLPMEIGIMGWKFTLVRF